jgi:hypothetical protein
VAAEAAAAAEAAERAAREAAAARAAIKQKLRDSSSRYQLALQGTAVASPLSAGGRQPQLSVTLSFSPSTAAGIGSSTGSSAASGPPVAKVQRVYDSTDAATDGAGALAVQAAQEVYTHFVPAATEGVTDLLGMTVSGAQGVQLSEADNMLWRLLLLARLETAGRQAVGQVAPLAASGELQQGLQVCCALLDTNQGHLCSRPQLAGGLGAAWVAER